MLFAAGASSIKGVNVAVEALSRIKEPIEKVIVLKSNGFEACVAEACFYQQIDVELKLPTDNDYFTQRDLDINTLLDPEVTEVLLVTGKHVSPRIAYLKYRAIELNKKVYCFTVEDLFREKS